MKISIERGALLKAVSQAQSVVERRNTIPILANVLIEAEGEADLALRVAVRPGGCSGYSYEMFFDSETEADDKTGTPRASSVRYLNHPDNIIYIGVALYYG